MESTNASLTRCIQHVQGIVLSISYCQDDKLAYYIESLREEMIGKPRYARVIRKLLAACIEFNKEATAAAEELDLD